MFRIFLTNLGKYNEGELVGEWVDLPVYDDFKEAFNDIGIDERYEEWFITDYETDYGLHIGEYDDIYELNELAGTLEDMMDYEKDIITALVSGGYDVEEAIDKRNDVIVYCDCYDMTEVAERFCEECGILDSIPDDLQMYFDYEAYGRDMSINGTFIEHDGNMYEVLW